MNITLRLRYERGNDWSACGSREPSSVRDRGQQNLECGALPNLANDGDRPIHPLNYVFHDGKPQTGASDLPRAGLVDAVKALEDARQIPRRDANARIGDHYGDPAIVIPIHA